MVEFVTGRLKLGRGLGVHFTPIVHRFLPRTMLVPGLFLHCFCLSRMGTMAFPDGRPLGTGLF